MKKNANFLSVQRKKIEGDDDLASQLAKPKKRPQKERGHNITQHLLENCYQKTHKHREARPRGMMQTMDGTCRLEIKQGTFLILFAFPITKEKIRRVPSSK
jgi:hypothetical protein